VEGAQGALGALRRLPSFLADAAVLKFRFMSDGSKIGESHKALQEARRRRRLAAALRENLKRRKAQARAKAPHDSAGIADDKSNR
jgi:hypothetical protein